MTKTAQTISLTPEQEQELQGNMAEALRGDAVDILNRMKSMKEELAFGSEEYIEMEQAVAAANNAISILDKAGLAPSYDVLATVREELSQAKHCAEAAEP